MINMNANMTVALYEKADYYTKLYADDDVPMKLSFYDVVLPIKLSRDIASLQKEKLMYSKVLNDTLDFEGKTEDEKMKIMDTRYNKFGVYGMDLCRVYQKCVYENKLMQYEACAKLYQIERTLAEYFKEPEAETYCRKIRVHLTKVYHQLMGERAVFLEDLKEETNEKFEEQKKIQMDSDSDSDSDSDGVRVEQTNQGVTNITKIYINK